MLEEILLQYPRLAKWFHQLDCVSFSRDVIEGDPEIIRYAESKFLYSGCGLLDCGGNILITEINRDGKLLEIYEQMLRRVTPASYAVKKENDTGFFLPFEEVIMSTVHKGRGHLLKLLKDDPKKAALYLLVKSEFAHANIYTRQGIVRLARKFDAAVS